MRSNQTRPDLKRDLQILHRYKNSIEVLTRRLSNNRPENDLAMLVQILKDVKRHHENKLHQIINRNVKPRPVTVGDVRP